MSGLLNSTGPKIVCAVLVDKFYFPNFILCPKNCHDVICTSTPQKKLTLDRIVAKGGKGGPRHLICQRHLHWFEPPPMLSLALPSPGYKF